MSSYFNSCIKNRPLCLFYLVYNLSIYRYRYSCRIGIDHFNFVKLYKSVSIHNRILNILGNIKPYRSRSAINCKIKRFIQMILYHFRYRNHLSVFSHCLHSINNVKFLITHYSHRIPSTSNCCRILYLS